MQDYQRRKLFVRHISVNQERKLRDRRRLDTVVVLTVNDTDRRLGVKPFLQIPLASKGNLKSLGSRGSMVTRLKLKRIDGRAPPGVEFAA